MTKLMSKSELIQKVADQHSLSKKDVKGVIESLASVGYKELKKNGAFLLPGFAKFVVIKIKWHWRKRQKYVQNCIIRAASQQGIDIWEIRRAVNMKDLPSQDIDDWSFVFSRSRNR